MAEVKTLIGPKAARQKEYLQIQGQVINGLTEEPVAGCNVHLLVTGYDEENKGQLELRRYAISDADGRYCIENVPAKMLEKNRLDLTYELTGEGFVSSRYYEVYTAGSKHIVRNFGLLSADGIALVSGAIKDAVNEAPLAGIDVEVDIRGLNAVRKWSSIRKMKTQTDEQGEYELEVDAEYLETVERKYICRANPISDGYEVAIRKCKGWTQFVGYSGLEDMVDFNVQE